MLIKRKDDLTHTVAALTALLDLKTLTDRQTDEVQEELYRARAGAKGEKEAAYHIDFRLKDTNNWAVIHDLRLETNGRVAQIDHLLINRTLELFVIENKNVKTAVRFNQAGEFEVKTRYGWKGMASPVEQNKRHIRVPQRSGRIPRVSTHTLGRSSLPNLSQLGAPRFRVQPEQEGSGRGHDPEDGSFRPGLGRAHRHQDV